MENQPPSYHQFRSQHLLRSGVSAPSPTELPYPGSSSREDVKKSVFEVLEALRRGKWLMLVVFLLVMSAVVVFTFTVPPEYEAYALLLIDTSSGKNDNDALSFGAIDNTGLDVRNSSTQTLILQQSLTIAERTEMRLRSLQDAGERLTIFEEKEPLLTIFEEQESPLTAEDWAVLLQEEYISISPVGEEERGAIRINATSTNPSEAALIANVYADEYVQLSRETSLQRLTASRLFLEEQLTKHRADLLALEEQIKVYTSGEGALLPDNEAQNTVSQIARLKADLDAVRIEQSTKEASLRSLTQERQKLYPRLAEHVASGVKEEIKRAQEVIARLEHVVAQVYASNPALRDDPTSDPELDDLLTQITQQKDRVHQLSEQYVDETAELSSEEYLAELNRQIIEDRIALGAAEAKAEVLEQRLSEYNQKLRVIPGQSMRLAQLERERQSTEQLYLSIVKNLQEVQIAQESEVGFVRLIRPALVPDKPVRPNKAKNFMLGAMLSFMLGTIATVARQWLDTRIYSPDDLRGLLSVLGVIPDMTPMIANEFHNKKQIMVGDREISPTLTPLLNPFSLTSEAYRHLYLSLQFSRPDEVVQTVLVTSPEAEVGKSTTVINLAITAARKGRRTLIVDADLRRPTLRDKLGFTSGVGLPELLSEQGTRKDIKIERLATGIDNLYAITVAEPIAGPAELLGSSGMRELIEQFRHAFDLILIDSPPVLLVSDAMLLSTQCDATVMVAAAGSTDSAAFEQALEELRNVGATIVGAVLNRFNPMRMYGHKHTYGYRYKHYGRYSQPKKGNERARRALT